MAKLARPGTQQIRSRSKNSVDAHKPSQEANVLAGNLAQYITTRRAAEILGVTPAQVHHLLVDQRLQGAKLGHDWLVLMSSIEQYKISKDPRGRPPSRVLQCAETK